MKYGHRIIPFACVAGLVLAGCKTIEPVVSVNTDKLTDSVTKAQAALAIERAAIEAERSSRLQHEESARIQSAKLKANIMSADSALTDGRIALGHGEVRIADHRLEGVEPDPEELLQAEERRRLDAEAKVEQLEQNIQHAIGAAQSESARVARLQHDAELASSEAEKARVEAQSAQDALAKASSDLAAHINSAIEKERASVRLEQVATANRIGGFAAVLALAASVSIPWTKKLGVVIAGCLALGSAGMFAYARFISHPAFGWVTGSIVAIGIVLGIRHVWRIAEKLHYADKTEMVSQTVVDTLDMAYDNADLEHQAWMDERIFEELAKHGPVYRAAVHEIKASIKLSEPLDKSE